MKLAAAIALALFSGMVQAQNQMIYTTTCPPGFIQEGNYCHPAEAPDLCEVVMVTVGTTIIPCSEVKPGQMYRTPSSMTLIKARSTSECKPPNVARVVRSAPLSETTQYRPPVLHCPREGECFYALAPAPTRTDVICLTPEENAAAEEKER